MLPLDLIKKVDAERPATVFLFGNPYATILSAPSKIWWYVMKMKPLSRMSAADMLNGHITAKRKITCYDLLKTCLRVRGYRHRLLPYQTGSLECRCCLANLTVDSLANDAIRQQATPGCVVLVARNGRIVYHKAFGYQTYDSTRPVTLETIYDMASVTKICATTIIHHEII